MSNEYIDSGKFYVHLMYVICFLVVGFVVCFFGSVVYPAKTRPHIAVSSVPGLHINKAAFVDAIIGEAEGESYTGKLAVACAIRNRGTFEGVYGMNSSRVRNRLYNSKVFVASVRAYEESAHPGNCSFIEGATHWQSVMDIAKGPKWIEHYRMTAKIGGHFFFKHK